MSSYCRMYSPDIARKVRKKEQAFAAPKNTVDACSVRQQPVRSSCLSCFHTHVFTLEQIGELRINIEY